jgi:riboflavin biosynthesis pyrimidine reductase
MMTIFPTASGAYPFAPLLAEIWFSRHMARASIYCLAVPPTISGQASGQRYRVVRWGTASTPRQNTSRLHRPESLEGGPYQASGPDIVEDLRRIKATDGPDLILWGSSTLIATLLENDLADEILLFVYPVLLGMGKRFFAEGNPFRTFELVSTETTPTGIILSHYKVAGPLKTA